MATSNTPIADADKLGYTAYSNALWQRIEMALAKDAKGGPLGDDPLVVGIFGEWGAGKSQLLKILFERAQQQSAMDIAARSMQFDPTTPFIVIVPVFFQPWKYEHEPHVPGVEGVCPGLRRVGPLRRPRAGFDSPQDSARRLVLVCWVSGGIVPGLRGLKPDSLRAKNAASKNLWISERKERRKPQESAPSDRQKEFEVGSQFGPNTRSAAKSTPTDLCFDPNFRSTS